MFFKRFMAAVLTIAMLCSSLVLAENGAGLLISQNPIAAESAPVLSQEEINKNATGFIDVTADAPYFEALKKLVDYGIIAGYPDGSFKPEGEVTRAEMCKMINLTLGFTDFGGVAGFKDVTMNNWYFTYALAAQKQGYVEGYEDKTFRGSNNITRQEVCAILNRLLKPMNLGIPVTINDEVSNWARPHVELIVQNFIMPLEEGGTFRATQNLKRHELATVLSNMAIGPVKPIDMDVRFFVNGEQYGETQTIGVGGCAIQPVNPQVPGPEYVFEGWRPIGTQDVVDVNNMAVVSDVDYEAVFVKKQYSVTFYSRGSVYETRNVLYGEVVSAPVNPNVRGYDFIGWSLSENGKVVRLSETKIYSDTTLYAVFEEIVEEGEDSGDGGGGAPAEEVRYSVKFFVNGDLYDTQKVLKNKSPKSPENPERDGYVFLGWSLEVDGEIIAPSSLNVTKNTTLYAVFEEEEPEEPEVYTVTFYVDGKKYDTQFVQEGDSISPVSNPKKDGYVFKHWSKTENGTEVMLGYYNVTSNTNFYAVFEKEEEEINYFTVTFMVDGEEYSSSTVQEGKKVSAPTAPAKEGYTFKGWSKTEGGSTSSVTVEVKEDLVFYAVFEKIEPKKYKVVFKVDGKTVDEQLVLENETVDLPANPVKEGYTFKGWAERDGGDVINAGAVVIDAPKTFYAVFEEKEEEVKTYTINFIVDGRTYSSLELEEGAIITLPDDPEKSDHIFLGWSKSNGGSVVTVDSTAKANASYYAVFKEIKKYNVVFYFDGREYKKVTVVEGETVSAPASPSVEGYKFLGWSKAEGSTDIVEVGSVKITSDTSFYAVLEEVEPEKVFFTVTFKADGKNFSSASIEQGQYASEPSGEPEKEGYTFKGWAAKSGGTVIDVSSVVINSNTTFYAVFEKNPVYHEVVFISDGEVYDEQKVLEGDYPDVPGDPELDGHNFLGWSKTDGGSTVYPDRIAVNADITYFAVFEKKKEEIKYYKVLFWFDGEVYKSYEVASGETVSAPSIPKIEDGAEFFGWSLDDSNDADSVIDVSDYEITGHTDFYSVLIKNPNDPVLMEMLVRGHSQLSKIRLGGVQKKALDTIKECVGYVIEDANMGEKIDKRYVSQNYSDMIDEVKYLFNSTMTSTERSSFVNAITNERNVDKDVQDFLIDYFDINTSI